MAGRPAALGLPYRNVLNGHARGAEFTLQRRSANRLTGWLSYAYSATNYTDRVDGLQFVSNFDQRRTLTAFGSYRVCPTFDLSSQWRYGSGEPVAGFLDRQGESLSLTAERNAARMPSYSRLDFRTNKAFLFRKWKLTLSAEVLNVLNRENLTLVATDPVRIYSTGRLAVSLDRSFGVLPSIAIAASF
ncbi:MAG: TonB-dependent receptor [Acidobacteriia bacterium]|nr:TonB-dependent receptor [Terriglobia bacterium]